MKHAYVRIAIVRERNASDSWSQSQKLLVRILYPVAYTNFGGQYVLNVSY